jgi:hypothetical protein
VYAVTSCEDRDYAALDAHIRSQLARAAETYVPIVNTRARLKAVLEAKEDEDQHGTATADS